LIRGRRVDERNGDEAAARVESAAVVDQLGAR